MLGQQVLGRQVLGRGGGGVCGVLGVRWVRGVMRRRWFVGVVRGVVLLALVLLAVLAVALVGMGGVVLVRRRVWGWVLGR